MKLKALLCGLSVAMLFGASPCSADSSVGATRIVVASAPGGNLDVLARILAEKLSTGESTYFVENRAGAGGNIATANVAQSKPDGRTLLIVSTSHTSNVHLYAKVGYDPVTSFTPITSLAESSFAVVVPAASPLRQMSDLVDVAKASPGKLSYGSSGIGQGNHLGMELLKSGLGLDLLHVPFGSAGAVSNAVMGNQIDVAMLTLPGALAGLEAGKVRVLAVTGKERVPQMPQVPTVTESTGLPLDLKSWQGLVGPAGMDAKEVQTLSDRIAAILARPEVVAQLSRVALTPKVSGPAPFKAFIASETQRWGDVIQTARIRLE